MQFNLSIALSLALVLTACGKSVDRPHNGSSQAANGSSNASGTKGGNSSNNGSGTGSNEPTSLLCSVTNAGKSYMGLGGVALEAGRDDADSVVQDRFRLKTTDLIRDTYTQIFGAVPKSFANYTQTFGVAVPRFATVPVPSVFTNYAFFVIGRDAAQTVIKADASWAARTTADQIKEGCAQFALKAWKHEASAEAIAACQAYIQSPELSKLTAADRWSYGMASILSSIDFISY